MHVAHRRGQARLLRIPRLRRLRRPAQRHDRRPALSHPRGRGSPLNPELHGWFDEYLEACNRHDLERVRGFLHPDVRRSGAARGADAWIRDLEALLTAFPDHRWKRIAVVVEDDRVAAHLRTRGTHRGTWLGVRATGRHVGTAEFGFYRVSGGLITEYAGGADGLLAQLTD